MSEDDTEVTPSATSPPGEEEELLLKIDEQNDLIDEFPRDTYLSAGMHNRILHQRKLGQLEFTYTMLGERKRLSAVLAEYQERYGAIYSEPCLICLEDIFVHATSESDKSIYLLWFLLLSLFILI